MFADTPALPLSSRDRVPRSHPRRAAVSVTFHPTSSMPSRISSPKCGGLSIATTLGMGLAWEGREKTAREVWRETGRRGKLLRRRFGEPTTIERATMWGAIIGDIVGSVHEWDGIKTRDFEFFNERGHITDDSVCTAAVADILLRDLPAAATLQEWCRRYPDMSYGDWFRSRWMWDDSPEPYDSYGNGAAMRVSPAAFLNRNDLAAALAASDRVTAVTHDHPEGMKGARAAVHAIWLALDGEDPGAIRATVEAEYGYDLTRTVDEIRPDYVYDETCQRCVPEAVTCALESASFEDAVRNAVSLGGDADTLASIAGPVAEALHGIPEETRAVARERYLGEAGDIVAVMAEMYGG